VSGSDGALWFTNSGNNSIGRITTGGAITSFVGRGIDDPAQIAAGADGALWFTNFGGDSIGRNTTAGLVTKFKAAEISTPLNRPASTSPVG
jgi:virginiamycin B lyase